VIIATFSPFLANAVIHLYMGLMEQASSPLSSAYGSAWTWICLKWFFYNFGYFCLLSIVALEKDSVVR